jgi:hypothetical protein
MKRKLMNRKELFALVKRTSKSLEPIVSQIREIRRKEREEYEKNR